MDLSQLSNLQADRYIKASFLTILVYDWFITFSDEISYIWYSRWGVIKLLFIYTRYSTFVDIGLAFQEQFEQIEGPASQCNTLFETLFSGVGMGICGLIMMIWTYTLFERSRKVLCVFGLSWLITGGISGWAIVSWRNIAKATASLGCSSHTSNLRYIAYSTLLALEAVIVILTMGKAMHIASRSRIGSHSLPRRIAKVFNECGVWFFLGVLAFTLTDVLFLFIAPDGLLLYFDSPLRVMHTVLVCRLVLHLRVTAIAKKEESLDQGSQIRSLRDLFEEDPDSLDIDDPANDHTTLCTPILGAAPKRHRYGGGGPIMC